MKRLTKRKVSTIIGCTLGAVTFTGPMAGHLLAEYQCRHGLCSHAWHRHRYRASSTAPPKESA